MFGMLCDSVDVLFNSPKERHMETVVLALKVSLVSTSWILAIVALVQLGKLRQDHERTKSVLKATMVEIERLRDQLPGAKA